MTDATTQGQRLLHEGLHLPAVQPVNSSNLCYINSVMQAANWLGAITSAPALCFGRLQAGFRIFGTRRRVRLIDVYAFRPLFLSWADIHRQHDAGEFLGALLTAAQSEAYACRWEARSDGDRPLLYSGTLEQPIVLPIAGTPPLTLQSLLDHWHMQHAVHALLKHKGLIWLQLERYTHGANKCEAPVRVRPGDSVAVPFFTEPAGLTLRHESFTVAALVYHLGDTALSGHYMTLIGKPQGANWEYYVCDDNSQPRRGEVADLQLVDHNAYLVGLVRGL